MLRRAQCALASVLGHLVDQLSEKLVSAYGGSEAGQCGHNMRMLAEFVDIRRQALARAARMADGRARCRELGLSEVWEKGPA